MGLDIGSVLSETFRMLGRRFWLMLALLVIYWVIQMVGFMVFGGVAAGTAMAAGEAPDQLGAGMILMVMLFYVLYFLITFAQSASLSHMASSLHQPGFGESFTAGLRSAPTLLGVTVVLVIAYVVLLIPISIAFAGLGAAGGSAIVVVLALLLIPAGIFVGCRLMPLTPVVAVERVANPFTAIQRTWIMTRGNVLSIFVVLLVLVIVTVVAVGIPAAPLFAMIGNAEPGTPPDFGALGAFTILGMLIAFVVVSLMWSAATAAIHAGLSGHIDNAAIDAFS